MVLNNVNTLLPIAIMVAIWLVINLLYRVCAKFLRPSTETLNVSVKYGIFLIVKKHFKSSLVLTERAACTRAHYVNIVLYAVALLLALLTFTKIIYAGLISNNKNATIFVPGLNVVGEDLIYFSLAILTGLLVHEYSHARTAARSGIMIKAMGIVVAFIIPAAFVEIDNEGFREKTKAVKAAILAAGIAANMVVAIASLALLNYVTANHGLVVLDVEKGSLAEKSGLKPYDVIYRINGMEVTYDVLEEVNRLINSDKQAVFILEVYRHRVGYISITLAKSPLDTKLGVSLYCSQQHRLCIAPSKRVLNVVSPTTFFILYKLISWTHVVNYSMAIVNALPLFITDGDRILREFLGSKLGNILSTCTLLMLILALLIGARI